jgi:hypothetical protein
VSANRTVVVVNVRVGSHARVNEHNTVRMVDQVAKARLDPGNPYIYGRDTSRFWLQPVLQGVGLSAD